MRALLVHPNLFRHPVPAAPSGLAWLAAALRSRGARVRILDLSFVWNRSRVIPHAVREFRPDVVGLGIPHLDNDCAFHSLSFLPQIRWIVERIRRASGAPIVAGGSAASQVPAEILTYLGLTHGFVGADATRAASLLEAVAAGRDGTAIPGTVRWDGARYVREGRGEGDSRSAVVRDRPYSGAHDLVDYGPHLRSGGAAALPVWIEMEGISTRRSADELANEIGELEAVTSARRVLFAGLRVGDAVDQDEALLEALARRPRPPRFEVEVRAAALTPERIRLLTAAGCQGVRLRIPRADSSASANAAATAPGEDVDALRTALARVGSRLGSLLTLEVGGPGETFETLGQTLSMVASLNPRPTRVEIRVGARIRGPIASDATEMRGGYAGTSDLWPRFAISTQTGEALLARVRSHAADRPGWLIDADAYSPWYRVAFAVERRAPGWPRWKRRASMPNLPRWARKITSHKSTHPLATEVTSRNPFIRPAGV